MDVGDLILVAVLAAGGLWLVRKSRRFGTSAVLSALLGLVCSCTAAVLGALRAQNESQADELGLSDQRDTNTYRLHAARTAPAQYLSDPDPEVSAEAFAHFPTYLETIESD